MKPVDGRPKKVCAPGVPAAIASVGLFAAVRSDVAAAPAIPIGATALAPMNVSFAHPFWKVDGSVTFVRFTEPSTPDEVKVPDVLRIASTFDSQHSEFGAALGGSGEKST